MVWKSFTKLCDLHCKLRELSNVNSVIIANCFCNVIAYSRSKDYAVKPAVNGHSKIYTT